jgi:hypothetical protein
MSRDKIRTTHTTAWFDAHGILWIVHDDTAFIEIEDAVTIADKWKEIHQGRKFPHLVDFRNVRVNQSAETRAFFADGNDLHEIVSATALLVDNMANNLVTKFFVKVNKPSIPTKTFKDEKEAIEWLKGFL